MHNDMLLFCTKYQQNSHYCYSALENIDFIFENQNMLHPAYVYPSLLHISNAHQQV